MKVHTSLWPLHLLRQSSKVPMAGLAPGPLASARAGAALALFLSSHRAFCLATASGSSFTCCLTNGSCAPNGGSQV